MKWACEYCTYENYQASKKCVLCHAPRPLQVITDLENAEQDIYRVAELAEKNAGRISTSNKDTDAKWSCSMCTYLNWSSASNCAQCSVPKKQVLISSSSGGSSLSQERLSQPEGSNTATQISSHLSPDSAKTLRDANNDKNKAVAAYVRNTIKWACKACTYENYPRSKCCTICGIPRGKTYTENTASLESHTSPSGSGQDLLLHIKAINRENIRSAQSSPVISSNQNENERVVSNNNRSGHSSPVNNKSRQTSPTSSESGKKKNAGARTSRNNSGQNIANNRSGQNSPNSISGLIMNENENLADHNSPKNNRSGLVSPCNLSDSSGSDKGSPTAIRASIHSHNRNQNDSLLIQDGACAVVEAKDEEIREKRILKLRKRLTTCDIIWLNTCEAVVNGDPSGIEQFLTSGGDPSRQLTRDEVFILDRPSAFEVGYTLVHLALRFRRDDMVAILLTATDISTKGFKRLPSYSSPDIASEIRREIAIHLKQRKGSFPCYYLSEIATFSLPADIEDLPRHIQGQLHEEILDSDVDKELSEDLIINWSIELTEKLGSRLFALWNRTAGDCLLDSVLQATWGILDIDNTLRRALSDSLLEAAQSFYPRWKDYETIQAELLNFSLDEGQWQRDWTVLLSLASQPGASLEHVHIFALAHILRRPIIVYGVKVVKSFRGETIDFARFEGVYLPLMWERNFCWKSPIALGYTRGHFSALVPMEIDTDIPVGAGAHIDNAADEQITYLPLVDHEGSFLPIHFITGTEVGMHSCIFAVPVHPPFYDTLASEQQL